MLLKAKTILFADTPDGRKPVWPGIVFEASEKEAKELIQSGAAAMASTGAASVTSRTTPEPQVKNDKGGYVKPEEHTVEGETEDTGEKDLSALSYTELKKMAQDMGVFDGKMKSKTAVIAAIEAGSEELPDIHPQDVVEG